MPKGTHAEYLAFQKSLARRIAREVGEDMGRITGKLRGYYVEYLRDVADYQRVSTKHELVRDVLRARIVLGGDYHSLDQSKKTHLRILRRALRRRRDVILALECISSAHQAPLDDFMAGRISEEELLSRARYREEWGFEWWPYRELLDFARAQSLPVIAANMPAGRRRPTVKERDAHMASVVAALARDRDPALIYLIVGDWHLARDHLPFLLSEALHPFPPILVIYQNSESIYWKLASRGLEQATDVVKVRDGAYCVVNATPFVKLASYALWAGRREEASLLASQGALAGARAAPAFFDDADPEEADADPSSDLADTVSMFARAICRFFDLDAAIDFTVFTPSDQTLLQRLVRDLSARGADFLHEVAVHMYYRRSFYIPPLRAVYLGTASLNQMADMASIYLYHTISGADSVPSEARRAFYTRVLREAVTFMGSKIINHKRPHRRRRDYEIAIEEARGRRTIGIDRERLHVARAYLEHRALEKRLLAGSKAPRASRIYTLKPVIRWGLTRGLGQALGAKLYEGMVRGVLEKTDLARLYGEDWGRPGSDPLARYLELVRETMRIKASIKEKDERL